MILKSVMMAVLVFFLTTALPFARSGQVELTPAELSWIAKHKTIRMSGPQAFPPFQFYDDKGTFQGMASDYLFLIADMVGLTLETVDQLPWPDVLKKMGNREIDILSCAVDTPERRQYAVFSKPHLSFPLIIVSRSDAPFIEGIQSLHKRTVALVRKNSTVEWLQRERIQFQPFFVDSPLDAMKAVALGQADVTIENLAAATYLIGVNGLTNLKIAAPTSYDNYTLSMAVRRDWPELTGILNKAIDAIPIEKHNEIRQKWMSVRYEHGFSTQDVLKWVGLVAGASLILLSSFFVWNRKLSREILERIKAESEKEKTLQELKEAFDEIRTLRGILPICCECKKIRDDKGYWNQIEHYISSHTEAEFSHGLCPDCSQKLYSPLHLYKIR